MFKPSEILLDPKIMPTATGVSLVVGSILFTIDRGAALAKREMTKTRWL